MLAGHEKKLSPSSICGRDCRTVSNKLLSRVSVTAFVLLLGGGALRSQIAPPQPVPMPAPIEAPKDTRYPGTIRLSVDARDLDRHVFAVRETIPVRAGEQLVLLYPQWLPGNHAPRGRVDMLAGLMIRANGTRLEWRRDV